uniref:Uncharacterized protein n=1 Tax=Opuntia streptacantha TaxID=393608 RepID=A0A7C9EUC4_OPUST
MPLYNPKEKMLTLGNPAIANAVKGSTLAFAGLLHHVLNIFALSFTSPLISAPARWSITRFISDEKNKNISMSEIYRYSWLFRLLLITAMTISMIHCATTASDILTLLSTGIFIVMEMVP